MIQMSKFTSYPLTISTLLTKIYLLIIKINKYV